MIAFIASFSPKSPKRASGAERDKCAGFSEFQSRLYILIKDICDCTLYTVVIIVDLMKTIHTKFERCLMIKLTHPFMDAAFGNRMR